MYAIVFHSHTQRDLDAIPDDIWSKIDKAILGLAQNPRPPGVKKLNKNLFRIRIGSWRVIYAVADKELKVMILRVARRNEKTYRGIN